MESTHKKIGLRGESKRGQLEAEAPVCPQGQAGRAHLRASAGAAVPVDMSDPTLPREAMSHEDPRPTSTTGAARFWCSAIQGCPNRSPTAGRFRAACRESEVLRLQMGLRDFTLRAQQVPHCSPTAVLVVCSC